MSPATVSRRRDKRFRMVCLPCHQKKIKCDIQQNPAAPCSKCVDAGAPGECRIRPSKRQKSSRWDTLSSNPASSTDARVNVGSSCPASVGVVVDGLDAADGTAATAYDAPDHAHLPLSLLSDAVDMMYGSGQGQDPHGTTVVNGSNISARCPSNSYSGPSPASSAPGGPAVASYLGDSGYLRIFRETEPAIVPGQENGMHESLDQQRHHELPPPALQQSYLETYFKFCYTWCPILDRTETGSVPAADESPLVQNAVALIGSHMAPPVMRHAEPVVYYERAKAIFYSNQEKNSLLAISGLMLFYWYGSSPFDVVSMDTAWWWTGVAIRQSQQLGLHREPRPGQPHAPGASAGLRRRIWWTLFARERLTGICTGRPCMIDPEDCNVAELTLGDFPETMSGDHRPEIFIQWVRLGGIIDLVSKHLLRKTESTPFPAHLAQQLKAWTKSLPPRLRLPIDSKRTTQFDPDVHQLHLSHLTTVTLLYLDGTSRSLPRAYTTAVLASCCVARIFEDYTARGSLRFLTGIAGWSIAIAILALLHARKVPRLTLAADDHIRVLRVALREMSKMWHSALMFERGFEKFDRVAQQTRSPLDEVGDTRPGIGIDTLPQGGQSPLPELSDRDASDGLEWGDFFPYLTPETSPLAAILLAPLPSVQFADFEWPVDFTLQLQGFFDPLGDLRDCQMMLNE